MTNLCFRLFAFFRNPAFVLFFKNFRVCSRNGESEFGIFSFDAFNKKIAFMLVDYRLDDIKSKADSGFIKASGFIGFIEPVKYLCYINILRMSYFIFADETYLEHKAILEEKFTEPRREPEIFW